MSARSPRQRGIAAVELALLLPAFILLLALPLLLGRAFYQYQVMQKAAHDAARYLSSCATIDLKTPARTAAVVAAARAIATAELDGPAAGAYAPVIGILCDGGVCAGFVAPATVTVEITNLLEDSVFPTISYNLLGMNGLPLTATASMRHVGN